MSTTKNQMCETLKRDIQISKNLSEANLLEGEPWDYIEYINEEMPSKFKLKGFQHYPFQYQSAFQGASCWLLCIEGPSCDAKELMHWLMDDSDYSLSGMSLDTLDTNHFLIHFTCA